MSSLLWALGLLGVKPNAEQRVQLRDRWADGRPCRWQGAGSAVTPTYLSIRVEGTRSATP